MKILINEAGVRWLVLGRRGVAVQADNVWASSLSRLDSLPSLLAVAPMLVAIIVLVLSVLAETRTASPVSILPLFLIGGAFLFCRVSFKARTAQEIGRITRIESPAWPVLAHVWLCLLLFASCVVLAIYRFTQLSTAPMLQQALLFAVLLAVAFPLVRRLFLKRDA